MRSFWSPLGSASWVLLKVCWLRGSKSWRSWASLPDALGWRTMFGADYFPWEDNWVACSELTGSTVGFFFPLFFFFIQRECWERLFVFFCASVLSLPTSLSPGRQQRGVWLVCCLQHPHAASAWQQDRGGELQPGDGEHGFWWVWQTVLRGAVVGKDPGHLPIWGKEKQKQQQKATKWPKLFKIHVTSSLWRNSCGRGGESTLAKAVWFGSQCCILHIVDVPSRLLNNECQINIKLFCKMPYCAIFTSRFNLLHSHLSHKLFCPCSAEL